MLRPFVSNLMRVSLLLLCFCVSGTVMAQTVLAQTVLPGHVHPKLRAATDLGAADSSLPLDYLSVELKRTDAQQKDLDRLLAQQQDPSSPDYHKWLTPEQYGERFGATEAQLDKLTAWLAGQNLKVLSVARGRDSVAFSGNVRQVEKAFSTTIHRYNMNGESHFANTADPTIPAEFNGLIASVHGLHDFKLKPAPMAIKKLPAKYTSGTSGNNYIGPDDIAAIYDIKPLLNRGIDGTGQKIVIVGQTNILLSDIQEFRSFFNLPVNDPQLLLVPQTKDPGILDDQDEANLDIEFSGAVARNAKVIYVYSPDVTVSVKYAIDNALAPVVSMSYGDCESSTGINGSFGLVAIQTLAQKGNAMGITWMAASGDSGAADCYLDNFRGNTGAQAAVDAPGSIPEVTSVGGTEFSEGSKTYFTASNDLNHASAFTYIPEIAWNDSVLDGGPSSTGGGVSLYFTKPTWQTGTGVPTDGFRDVPDISFTASQYHDAMLYTINGSLGAVGGTSVAAPTFAGIVALLNQYLVANGLQATAGVGNMNPRLYALAQSAPSAFHDVTLGDNIVNGCTGTRNCTLGPVGYSAGPGYDLATGLGSLDVFNFVTSWSATTARVSKTAVSMTLTPGSTTGAFTAAVTAATGTPTGTVNLIVAGTTVATATLSSGVATFNVEASKLPAGFAAVTAEYSGDAAFASAAASTTLTVLPTTTTFIQGVTNGASFRQAYAAGEIMAVFGSVLSGSTQSAPVVPLPTTLGGTTVTINGTPAPLYFVSPGQINLQIPYGLTSGAIATLVVSFNGQTATYQFIVSTAAPGIFLDSTGAPAGAQTAKRGDTIAIYVTGQGSVSPQPALGALPLAGTVPKPLQSLLVSIGGISAATPYAYVGVPAWAIGLTQINFTIPATAPLGLQPVIVTSGTATSAAAMINITQ